MKQNHKSSLFWAGILVRFLTMYLVPSAQPILGDRVEVTTPVTSFKRLMEGVYLWRHGIPPYEGGLVHHAPILLPIFANWPPILTPLLFIILDYAIARSLVRIAIYKNSLMEQEKWPDCMVSSSNSDEDRSSDNDDQMAEFPEEEEKLLRRVYQTSETDLTRPKDLLFNPENIGTLYLLNPFSILSCISQSTQLFNSLCILVSVIFAINGKRSATAFFMACAAYLSFYPVVLLAPCIMILSASLKSSIFRVSAQMIPLFVICIAVLLLISRSFLKDWQFLYSTLGTIILVPDLTPNIGLHWYFLMECFEQFRMFFLSILHLNGFIFAIPIAIKFSNQPVFVIACMLAFTALFKSYPSLADTSLYLPLFALHPEIFRYAQHTYVSIATVLYAAVLGPLFYDLWIYLGSGNSNFFYAITLVFSLAQVALVVDLMYANVRREWDRQNPGWRQMRVELAY